MFLGSSVQTFLLRKQLTASLCKSAVSQTNAAAGVARPRYLQYVHPTKLKIAFKANGCNILSS